MVRSFYLISQLCLSAAAIMDKSCSLSCIFLNFHWRVHQEQQDLVVLAWQSLDLWCINLASSTFKSDKKQVGDTGNQNPPLTEILVLGVLTL